MMPAFSHLNKVGEDGKRPMVQYALAAKELQLMNWIGMEEDADYAEIAATGARTVRIIKPFRDRAVIIDIDHVPGKDGKYDIVDGIPMGPVTREDLRAFVAASPVPFVAKGVLSVQDALKAKEAGCAAIVVSHHHGRIPFGIAPLQVLPRIREALAGSGVKIFVDCSMDSGYDAYKALALGADAVSEGRGILSPLLKEGTEGVKKKIRKMNEELAELMMYTGVGNTEEFDPTVLYF